jgi:hypothetical protein
MAKAKKKTAVLQQPFPVPAPVQMRGGCKVSWYYYPTKEEALRCSEWAKVEAEKMWAEGYDFGYCSPGSIVQKEPGATIEGRWIQATQEYERIDVSGLYEVCIP